MRLICTNCRVYLKKKDTKVYSELIRIGTSNAHCSAKYRICNKCGTEVYDYKLEKQNLKKYVKQYKFTQWCIKREAKNGK
jgi:hypothetical protein